MFHTLSFPWCLFGFLPPIVLVNTCRFPSHFGCFHTCFCFVYVRTCNNIVRYVCRTHFVNIFSNIYFTTLTLILFIIYFNFRKLFLGNNVTLVFIVSTYVVREPFYKPNIKFTFISSGTLQ